MKGQEKNQTSCNINTKVDKQDYSLVVHKDNTHEQINSSKNNKEYIPKKDSRNNSQKIERNKKVKKEINGSGEEYRRGYNSGDYEKKGNSYYDGKYDSYYNGNFDSDDESQDDSEDEEEQLGNKDDFSNYDSNDRDISIGMPVYERIICKEPKDDGLNYLPGCFMTIMFISLLLFPFFSVFFNSLLKLF